MAGAWPAMAGIGLAAGAGALGAGLARRGFREKIERLQRTLDLAPRPLAARTDLPAEVSALARRLGVREDGGGRIARLTQSGELWLKPGSRPLAFAARQTIAVADLGFVWDAAFRTAGAPVRIVDSLVGDEGRLLGRLFDVFPLLGASGGDAMFRGEATRYMIDMLWAPDALLYNPRLDWRVIDAHTLAVATGEGARRCEVRMMLDEAGDPTRFEADDRPRLEGCAVKPTAWFGRGGGYRWIGPRRVPTEGEVGWRIDGGDFVYWRGRIESWSLDA